MDQTVRTYGEFRRAFASRREALGLSQLATDHIAGLPSGYVGKLECGMRHFGNMSLEVLLATLDLEIVIRTRSPERNEARAA